MYSPSLEQFIELARQGNVIPVTRRLLADIETPLSAYRKIRGPGESFLFESVEGGEHLGRYSFVGCNPRAIIRQSGNKVDLIQNGKILESATVDPKSAPGAASVKDGLEMVERVMGKFRPVSVPGLPRFTGGAIGFIGYEFIHDIEPVVPRPPRDQLGTPVMYFLIADQLLIFDRVAQTLTVLVNAMLEDAASPQEAYEDADACRDDEGVGAMPGPAHKKRIVPRSSGRGAQVASMASAADYRYRLQTWENEQGGRFMQTTVNLPDSLYQQSEALAASRGATVEQLIVEAVKKEVQGDFKSGTSSAHGDREVELPVIRSRRPGTLDLSHFDFDDLLA